MHQRQDVATRSNTSAGAVVPAHAGPVELSEAMLTQVSGGCGPAGGWVSKTTVVGPAGGWVAKLSAGSEGSLPA